jgi:hypothetical protein
MTTIARVAVLDLRTVASHRKQAFIVFASFAVVAGLLADQPVRVVPALVLLVTSTVAVYPFIIGEKAGLETLYALLPVPRRTVLLGHYAWAMASFVATVVVGTAITLVFAAFEGVALSGHALYTMITLAWGLFAVNISIQLPVLIRWGYTRVGLWSTTAPLALVMSLLFKSQVGVASLDHWLPVFWPGGVTVVAASTAVATALDRRR